MNSFWYLRHVNFSRICRIFMTFRTMGLNTSFIFSKIIRPLNYSCSRFSLEKNLLISIYLFTRRAVFEKYLNVFSSLGFLRNYNVFYSGRATNYSLNFQKNLFCLLLRSFVFKNSSFQVVKFCFDDLQFFENEEITFD